MRVEDKHTVVVHDFKQLENKPHRYIFYFCEKSQIITNKDVSV